MLLASCMARQSPPVTPAKDVAPDVPYLWPEGEKSPAPVKPATPEALPATDATVGLDNGIIAVAGGNAITLKEFDYWFFDAVRGGEKADEELYHRVLDSIIDRVLMLAEAGRQNIEVQESEVEKSFEEVMRKAGGREKLLGDLKKNNQSLEELREQLKENLVISQLERRMYAGAGAVAPGEVRAEYERRSAEFDVPETRDASLILVMKENYKDPAKARETAARIHAELTKGTPFEDLARRHGEGPKAAAGGRQGFVKRGDLAEPITRVIFALASGTTSGVEDMESALFIARCGEVRPARHLPFEEVQERLQQEIARRNFDRRRKEVRESLRKGAYIKKLDPKAYLDYRRGQ